uniref:3'(2'),5'-bisphosphate nucleotidase n=1 Tax=Chlamydomonas euryale TaxID=1486919 RepID=A0A7R9YUZ8_9CHLO
MLNVTRQAPSGCRRAAAAVGAGTADMRTLSDFAAAGAPFGSELVHACRAVRLAAMLCKEVQTQLGDAEKEDKSDDSPVTVADYGAQVLVAWVLQKSCAPARLSMVAEEDSTTLTAPEGRAMLERITALVNSVVAEEEPGTQLSTDDVVSLIELGDSDGGPSGRHWVLDPIDGTRGFVGMRQYCICLGMMQDGVMQLGVLGGPNLPTGDISDDDGGPTAMARSGDDAVGSLFLAHKGFGAYSVQLRLKPSDPLSRLHVATGGDVSAARMMESYESRHSSHSFAAAVADELGITTPSLRMDSQVKYGLLARGDEARIFMRFPPSTYREKIWDHAAGVVVVEEAGGKVTDACGDPLDFSLGRYLDSMKLGIIAAPAALHPSVVGAIKAVSAKQEGVL